MPREKIRFENSEKRENIFENASRVTPGEVLKMCFNRKDTVVEFQTVFEKQS
jgi:hypothetical protein